MKKVVLQSDKAAATTPLDAPLVQTLSNINELIYYCDVDGQVIYINQYAKSRLSKNNQAKSIFDLHPQLTQKRWSIATRSAMDKGHWILQIRQSFKDNDRLYVEIRLNHQVVDGQNFFFIISREVSKIGHSDELLNLIAQATAELSGRDFFKMLVKQMANAMHVSKAFITECMDQPPTRVRMLAFWNSDNFDDGMEYDLNKTPCDRVINGRDEYFVEQSLGEIYPIEKGIADSYYGVPIYDGEGDQVIGHIAFLDDKMVPIDGIDCTIFEILCSRAAVELQRIHTQESLKKNQLDYQLLVENQTDLILRLDNQLSITFVSPSCCVRFDQNETKLRGCQFLDFIHEEEKEAAQKIWHTSLKSPYRASHELRTLTSQGWCWFAWVLKGVIDDSGKVTEIIAVGRDISARVRAEEQSRDTIAKLAHVGRVSSMGELATGIAHELNQPLTAILSFAQASRNMLNSETADLDEYKSILERIASNAELAGEIIQRVRGFVKKTEPKKSQTDLVFLINEITGLLSTKLRHNNIQLKLNMDQNSHLVFGDPIQIQQVLLNIVRNAIEAIVEHKSPTRKITISTKAINDTQVEVTIRDSGPGISKDIGDQLFEAFFSSKSEGLGVGLSICQSIIEAHGGKITVDSKNGKGTTFKFTLAVEDHELAQ